MADAVIATLTGRIGLTVIVMALDVAGLPVGHAMFDVSKQSTMLPLTGVNEYVALVAPATVVPFTRHWYAGDVPPLVGVAVKVTDVPEQTGFAEAVITTLTAETGLTVMVIVFDVAGFPDGQLMFDVRTQLTAFPLTGVNA